MCSENSAGTSNQDTGHSIMSQSSIFHNCPESVDRHTENSEGNSSAFGPSISRQPTSVTSQSNTDGMQIIRRSLYECTVSPEITDIIMLSWRDVTQKQYNGYIKQWIHFCNQASFDPLHPSVNAVLAFLHSLANTARSAVSNIDINYNNVCGHVPIDEHPLVSRYLKGIFNKLKPVPKIQ